MTGPRAWAHDLALGARLAMNGRAGLSRLALIAAGVGVGVAVLLLATSLVNADEARKARETARIPMAGESAGPDPSLLTRWEGSEYRGQSIEGYAFDPVGADPPVPPGIETLPADGEAYLSPALAELLNSPDGELLRPRFPWTVVGTIASDGLVDPDELRFYTGADLESAPKDGPQYGVSGFGAGDFSARGAGVSPGQVLLALSGGLLLLVPVFVLIGAATRIAAAARERRLAALRLVGADANQARRIATGDALVGSLAGLLVGAGMFAAVTPLAEHVTLMGYGAFPADLRPSAFGAVLIAVIVPALAVLAGLVALRHSLADPLGTTRRALPRRRRLWWRLIPLATGVTILVPLAGAGAGDPGMSVQVAVLAGLGLVGLSVPLLLPWLLQRAVAPLAGGSPSWQLAVRRLQLDSGTPARAAAGIAALLTVSVAVQTLVTAMSVTAEDGREDPGAGSGAGRVVEVSMFGPDADVVELDLDQVPGVLGMATYAEVFADETEPDGPVSVRVADCAALATLAGIETCTAGDMFVQSSGSALVGRELVFSRWLDDATEPEPVARWTVPQDARLVEMEGLWAESPVMAATVVLTPAAVPDRIPADITERRTLLTVDETAPDVVERVRNALAPLPASGAHEVGTEPDGNGFETQVRSAMLAGSVVVLALAAASMLIVSIEQVRERRRQLAALAATGVPRRTMAASVLWQALLPFAVAAVTAVTVGLALAVLFLRVFDRPMGIDWSGIVVLTGGCALAVAAVTGLTMPSLRAAARPESLRTE